MIFRHFAPVLNTPASKDLRSDVSTLNKDSSLSLMHHDPADLMSLITQGTNTCFEILLIGMGANNILFITTLFAYTRGIKVQMQIGCQQGRT